MRFGSKKILISSVLILSTWFGYQYYTQVTLVGFVLSEIRKVKSVPEYTLIYEGILTDTHCGRVNTYQTYGSYLSPHELCERIINQISKSPILLSKHQNDNRILKENCRLVSNFEYPTYEYYTGRVDFREKSTSNHDDIIGNRSIIFDINVADRNVHEKITKNMNIVGINTGGSEFHLKKFQYAYPTYVWLSITATGLLGINKDKSDSYYDIDNV